MHRSLSIVLSSIAFLTLTQVAQGQVQGQGGGMARTTAAPAAPAAPEVGQMAPDFTLPWADSTGARAKDVKLSDLKGKVVVLAFYPGDRTQGCTIEMTKFRDEYATLFGSGVMVLPISVDSIASHSSWAHDMKFQFPLVSDTKLTVADLYGAHRAGSRSASRAVFVIGKDGKIAYRAIPFNATAEVGYTTLASEVAKLR
jgi:peroxiredoxin